MLFAQIAAKANESCETGESDAAILLGRFQPALFMVEASDPAYQTQAFNSSHLAGQRQAGKHDGFDFGCPSHSLPPLLKLADNNETKSSLPLLVQHIASFLLRVTKKCCTINLSKRFELHTRNS